MPVANDDVEARAIAVDNAVKSVDFLIFHLPKVYLL